MHQREHNIILSSVNYSKKAIKNHHSEVPVVVQTNIKHVQQKKRIIIMIENIFSTQTANNSKKTQKN